MSCHLDACSQPLITAPIRAPAWRFFSALEGPSGSAFLAWAQARSLLMANPETPPDILRLARSVFTYLRDSAAQIQIVPGDARLSLESEPNQNYDVLVVDAFSGDAIPVHLLTKEAVALYARHLKPDGILAIHVSNQYLNLAPVVQQLVSRNGYEALLVKTGDQDFQLLAAADWMLATRRTDFLNIPDVRKNAEKVVVPSQFRPWTDNYNDLLEVMKWIPGRNP